jgi:hypothetical protein
MSDCDNCDLTEICEYYPLNEDWQESCPVEEEIRHHEEALTERR